MSNKYVPRMDEEELAKKLDDMRVEWCKCGISCERCCWSLPDDKCILITAEHHISERYKARFENLKRHYGKLCKFIMNLEDFTLQTFPMGWKVQYYEGNRYLSNDEEYGEIYPETALELVDMVNAWVEEEM